MINDEIKNTYDKVQYKSIAFTNSSINRLCATARVYGLQTPLPNNAKVLEIGCAAGGNIISQAINYPNASFVGIDLSSEQVKIGNEAIKQSGLKNIKLLQMDATKACDELRGNEFDYIICHGVYSWVPNFVKKAIFEIGAKLLSPKGVMMVSFNVYPGWKYKEPTRDFMRFASRQIDHEKDPENKLDLALAGLKFEDAVYKSVPLGKKAKYLQIIRDYNSYMSNEIMEKKANRSYLIHEFLELFNEPSYLLDFVADAYELGLAYIEDISTHFDVSELSNKTLKEFANTYFKDRIAKDQMFDFLYSTQFRHALLTKKENESSLIFDYTQIDKNLDDIYIGLNDKFKELKERTKGLPMDDLACALVDAYPAFIKGSNAKKLIKTGNLAEHIFDINSALNGGVSFSCENFKLVAYEQGQSRIKSSYANYINYLKNEKSNMLGIGSTLNTELGLMGYDFFILCLLDEKKSKMQIANIIIDLLYENNNIKDIHNAQREENIQKILKQIDALILNLEKNFMFEIL